MKQQLYELPKGWQWSPLGDVVTLINGRAYKKNELLAEGPTPVLRVGNFFSNRGWYYSDLELPSEKYCEEGDLLYAWSASFGPKIWNGPRAIFHYHIWKIETSNVIDKYYLRWLLEFDSKRIKAQGNGVAMAHATKGSMEKHQIPLPPLNEQKRIVAKLDALFTRIDTAISHLQEILELSRALFASALIDSFEKNPAWKSMQIKDVFTVINGRAYKKPELLESGKYPVVRIQNLKGGDAYYYSDLELKADKYCMHGDLLFSWSGTPGTSFGAFIWEGRKSIFHYHIWNMKPLIEIDHRFAYWLLRDLTEVAIANSRGVAGMLHITKGMMESFDVEIPPIEKQAQIAVKLDTLSERNRTLEVTTQEKLNDLTALKASLLDAAFRGQL